MDLMMGLSAIKQTLEITKELRSIDDKIVVAEFKLRISEIVDRLLDAKQALLEAQERESELRKEASELRATYSFKAKLRDSNGLLYETDETGSQIGEPYCNLCSAKDEKLIRMRHHPAKVGYYAGYKCDNCKTFVATGLALEYVSPPKRTREWP